MFAIRKYRVQSLSGALKYFGSVAQSSGLNLSDTPEDLKRARPFSDIPGPSAFGLLWNMVSPNGKYYGLSMNKVHETLNKEYGRIVKFPGILGREAMVVVYDAQLLEKVFRNEGQWPDRYSFRFMREFRLNERPEIFHGIGGLIQDQGQQWQDTRSKVNPVLMKPKTMQRYIGVVDGIATEFLERIRATRDLHNEVPADFANEMNKWSLESIAYIALDQRLGLLTETDPESQGQKLIECVHDFFQLTYELEIKPSIWMYYKTPTFHRGMKCLNDMTDIIISFVDKSIAEIDERGSNHGHSGKSIFEKLLKIDKRVAIIMALDMLMGGVDTTSNTVLTLLNLLTKHPDKQQILREEILQKLPMKDSPLTADLMSNMPYLRACIKESQRLMPVVSGNMRKLPKDVVLAGYFVPKEYYIATATTVLSLDEGNYKQPNEFIPERFLKEGGFSELKPSSPFAFLPFGFGPRMCVGKRIAAMEIEVLMTRLIRNFNIEWHYPEIQYKDNILCIPTGPLKFRFLDIA